METDGFQAGSLSPRRMRERKRACRGLGMADDSPSPSPNPTPLASPFEAIRDEQVVRARMPAPRSPGPSCVRAPPPCLLRVARVCSSLSSAPTTAALAVPRLPPGPSPHTYCDATRLRRLQFPASTPWTTNSTQSARCTPSPWTPGRARMQTWARRAMWRRAIAWRRMLQAPTQACLSMCHRGRTLPMSMARLVPCLSERLRSTVRRSMREKRQLLLRAQPLIDTVQTRCPAELRAPTRACLLMCHRGRTLPLSMVRSVACLSEPLLSIVRRSMRRCPAELRGGRA